MNGLCKLFCQFSQVSSLLSTLVEMKRFNSAWREENVIRRLMNTTDMSIEGEFERGAVRTVGASEALFASVGEHVVLQALPLVAATDGFGAHCAPQHPCTSIPPALQGRGDASLFTEIDFLGCCDS